MNTLEGYIQPGSYEGGECLVSTQRLSHRPLDIIQYRVMFGYRLRVGYSGEPWCELDLCCGAHQKDFNWLFERVLAIMIHNGPENPLKGIPTMTAVKPYMNDDSFLDRIDELYKNTL